MLKEASRVALSFSKPLACRSCMSFAAEIHPHYSRHNLCVIKEVLQGITAGEFVGEVGGVADQPLLRPGRVNEPCQ